MVEINLSEINYTATPTYANTKEVYVATHAINIGDGLVALAIYIGLIWVYQKALKDNSFLLKLNKNAWKPEVKNKILKTLKWSTRIYPVLVIIIFALQILAFKTAYGI